MTQNPTESTVLSRQEQGSETSQERTYNNKVSTWLIIEDDLVFATLLQKRLIKLGFKCDHAQDSFSARQLLGNGRYQNIVLDLNLSESSGLVLIPEILERLPQAKILVLTGYASIATAVSAIKLGAINYLPKPASTQQIIAALNQDTQDSDSPQKSPDVERRLSPEELEWEHIQKVLQEQQGNISATARSLGMHRRTLQRKLAKKSPSRS